MALHSQETVNSIHIPYSYSYANESARTSATGFVSADVGKLALQEDTNDLYILTATTPTWKNIAGGSSSPGGSDTYVQFNDSGSFGGDSGMTYNKTTDTLSIANLDVTTGLSSELDAAANSIGFTAQSATGDGTTTVDWRNGNKFNFQFGAFNETFTFTAPTKPGNFLLKMVQDSTGSRTATWPATVKWPSGTAPTLTTTATTGTDIISFYYDGTNYWGVASLDFS